MWRGWSLDTRLAWQVKLYCMNFEIFSRKTIIILQKHIWPSNFWNLKYQVHCRADKLHDFSRFLTFSSLFSRTSPFETNLRTRGNGNRLIANTSCLPGGRHFAGQAERGSWSPCPPPFIRHWITLLLDLDGLWWPQYWPNLKMISVNIVELNESFLMLFWIFARTHSFGGLRGGGGYQPPVEEWHKPVGAGGKEKACYVNKSLKKSRN